MYYNASNTLISRDASNASAIIATDRALARSYAPDKHGWSDMGLLQARTGLANALLDVVMKQYIQEGVLVAYSPVQCGNCNDQNLVDPDEERCATCDTVLTEAEASDQVRYRVVQQPMMPIFDPATASDTYDPHCARSRRGP